MKFQKKDEEYFLSANFFYVPLSLFYSLMYLSDRDIAGAIEAGDISISDFDKKRLQPASYDIRLGDRFLIVKDYSVVNIDPVNHILPEYEEITVTHEQ
jgi:deoxycytidine triphosphate deaminase